MYRDVLVFCISLYNFYFGMWVVFEDMIIENGVLKVYCLGYKVYVD